MIDKHINQKEHIEINLQRGGHFNLKDKQIQLNYFFIYRNGAQNDIFGVLILPLKINPQQCAKEARLHSKC